MKTALWVITFVVVIIIPGHLVFGDEATSVIMKPTYMVPHNGRCELPYLYDTLLNACRVTETHEVQKSKPSATFVKPPKGNQYGEWSKYLLEVWCAQKGILCDLGRAETASPSGSREESWCWENEHWRRNTYGCILGEGVDIPLDNPIMRMLMLVELAARENDWRNTRQAWQDWARQVQQQSQKDVMEVINIAMKREGQIRDEQMLTLQQCQAQRNVDTGAMQRELNYKLDMMQRKQDLDVNFLATQSILQMMMLNQSPSRR